MKRGRIKTKYYSPKPGEWIKPVKRGYRLACCDCGLVHIMDFEHFPFGKGRKIFFRVFRDERSTAAMRRRKHTFVKGKP